MRASFLALVPFVAVLSACTGGNIVDANNRAFIPRGWPGEAVTDVSGQVAFQSLDSTADPYYTNVTFNDATASNATTFSFDPYAPASATNNRKLLPPGRYTVALYVAYTDVQSHVRFRRTYLSSPFDHSYDGDCTDHLTGANESCAIYTLKIAPGSGAAPPAV